MAMKEELTTAMHSEFSVSKETDIKLRAGCVWTSIDGNASRKEVEEEAKWYGITYDQCMEWKSYWERVKIEQRYIDNKKKQMAHPNK